MKIALCFSGYPRFTSECFFYIKNNLINNLNNYDIYAYFQWDNDWKNKKIHHEYNATFIKNEVEEFKKYYSCLNLKNLTITEPIIFDTAYYNKLSLEPDLIINNNQAKDILYRFKAQYKSIANCISLIKDEYDYIVRLRTDNIIQKPIYETDLCVDYLTTQNGFCAGHDRPHSDWFMVCPFKQKQFFNDLEKVETHFKDGIIHMHRIINNIGSKYSIQHKQFNVDIPSTTNIIKLLK